MIQPNIKRPKASYSSNKGIKIQGLLVPDLVREEAIVYYRRALRRPPQGLDLNPGLSW